MPAGFSYEPSLEAIWSDVSPHGGSIVASRDSLRRRVSWPVTLRATGLGRIDGGEIILAPRERASHILEHLPDLARRGVAAIVVAEPLSHAQEQEARVAGVPIIVLTATATLRDIQVEMEQSILRRRRELFEVFQRYHGLLVEAALAGAELRQLLVAAARECQGSVFLDREGDTVLEGRSSPALTQEMVVRARTACRQLVDGCFRLQGSPGVLIRPVLAGRDRAGMVGLLGVDGSNADAEEALLAALSTACAIALARLPTASPPDPEALFDREARGDGADRLREEQTNWVAVAAIDPAESPARVERALTAELRARDVPCVIARSGQVSVAWIGSPSGLPWEATMNSVAARLGTASLAAGVSRHLSGFHGAKRAYREAIDALERGNGALLTRFESVELDAVLSTASGGRELADACLEPLLRSRSNGLLLGTLEAYLATGRNAKRASEVLGIHRNTLFYRLRHIERLLGVSLDEPDAVFRLDLSCRIRAAAQRKAGDDGSDYRSVR
jgi:PucR C-terminal helix-turn-helix domain/GGDEF-like domain